MKGINTKYNAIMILGTCSGSGKSLITTALCRYFARKGENVIPFKGQNMSNNAWVDKENGEMAYSQAVQAWAAKIEPISAMNPILLKPKGECTSEVIHLGKSVGIAEARSYYQEWFIRGWEAIKDGLEKLKKLKESILLVVEGAGSPVEINLQHKDLTNLKLAKHLNAKCILIADIERGGVFAQIIGTLALLKENEKKLINGIIINKFRGDISLFDEGTKWIEEKTKVPVLGIMPWLNELFPPEDSLDLLQRKYINKNTKSQIVVVKLNYISNFSDLDPLENDSSVQIKWVKPGESLGRPDAVIIPGSKQTIKDLQKIHSSGLGHQLKEFAKSGGIIFGICGGLQMLGESLEDPLNIEHSSRITNNKFKGLNLLHIKTIFESKKHVSRKRATALWPSKSDITGFELHHGKTVVTDLNHITPLCNESSLGWVENSNKQFKVAGTYLHGIFENDTWREDWLNQIRKNQGIELQRNTGEKHLEKREELIDRLTDEFEKHIDMSKMINL